MCRSRIAAVGHGDEVGRAHVARALSLIGDRDIAGLWSALALLTDQERKETATAVGTWSKGLQAERERFIAELRSNVRTPPARREWHERTWAVACVAVTGTFSAPTAAAAVLLRVARQTAKWVVPAPLMIKIARRRGLDWLPDLAGRLAGQFGDDPNGWAALDQILRAYQAPAPPCHRFVVGWLSSVQPLHHPWPRPPEEVAKLVAQQVDWLQASPYLRDLLPRVFIADGAWRPLEYGQVWRALAELSWREPDYRPQLLDGCLNRILLGGTASALRPFARLCEALAPDDDEVAARVARYTARILRGHAVSVASDGGTGAR